MNVIELFFTAFGLSMDAFAVSITDGLSCTNLKKKQIFSISVCFGLMQGLMPLAGFFLGKVFERYITAFDHYIALILLSYIGGKMLCDAISGMKQHLSEQYAITCKILLLQGLATSIDALAVGVSFSALPNVNIFLAVSEIALITGIFSITGVCFGKQLGKNSGNYAQLAGGIILIGIGLKIFTEHQFFS